MRQSQSVLGYICVVFSGALLFFGVCLALVRKVSKKSLSVYGGRGIAVVVLGDIGMSPRMQNHALCISRRFCSQKNGRCKVGERRLADARPYGSLEHRKEYMSEQGNNNHVYFVGYNETNCNSSIFLDKNITIVDLGKPWIDGYRKRLPLPLFLFAKIVEQSARLCLRLLSIQNLGGILLQVPPSIPAIPICLLVSVLRGVPFIIDWHNYGHTLLIKEERKASKTSRAVTFSASKLLNGFFVRSYRFFEFFFGMYSTSSFCVSKAMQKDLAVRGIQASVLYDKPSSAFKRMESISEKHSVLFKYFGSQTITGTFLKALNGGEGVFIEREAQSGVAAPPYPVSTDVKDVILRSGGNDSVLDWLFGECGGNATIKGEISVGSLTRLTERTDSRLLSGRANSSKTNSLFSEKQDFLVDEEDSQTILDLLYTRFVPDTRRGQLCNSDSKDSCLVEIKETSPVSELCFKLDRVGVANKVTIEIETRKKRPCVLVTSTSWTPDEDINLLLEALELYDETVIRGRADEDVRVDSKSLGEKWKTLPDLFLIITGKGPMKSEWIRKASGTGMKHVSIRTVFVDADDYPKILASSDLGISLHYSSSGLDLPMKVVDMLGVGIPIVSFGYKTMNELIDGGGDPDPFFTTPHELCERLTKLLVGFGSVSDGDPYPTLGLKKIAKRSNSGRQITFMQEWEDNAAMRFERMVI